MTEFARQVETLRPQLLRYARSQLRNDAWAEDAVSDTLLAALEKPQAFAGQSQLKTWLVGILKHKVIDQLRRHSRECTILSDDDETDIDELLFRADNHWREAPQAWSNPEAALEQRRFWEAFERCLERLPAAGGRVFFRREVEGDDTDTSCQAEGITPSNCWVILHRARISLRACLEKSWFGKELARAE